MASSPRPVRRRAVALVALGFAFGPLATRPAIAEEGKPDWVLSLGATAATAMHSFSNDWATQQSDGFVQYDVVYTSHYAPGTSFGLQGTAQVWLPSGVGLFAELQQESQQLDSEIAVDVTASLPAATLQLTGRSDTETFRRGETRIHMGAGYRRKVSSQGYVELTGGVTRFALEQELVESLDVAGECPDFGSTCTVGITVSQTRVEEGDAWGFNIGAAGSFFFSRNAGFGFGVRYSYGGAVEADGIDYFDLDGERYRTTVKIRPGGLTANLGLRIRF